MFLDFQSHSLVTVERPAPSLCRIIARSDDGLFSGEVALDVRLPALNIESVTLLITRDVLGPPRYLTATADRLVGVRVGQGMTRIVREIMGGPDGSARMTDMVLDSMEMLINGLTVPELRKALETGGSRCRSDPDEPGTLLNDVLIGPETTLAMAVNPRLKDSCAAFKERAE